ncbi:hypothetical protein JXO52_10945 [bacterium]|nr:hypothetical protein [bacterium]
MGKGFFRTARLIFVLLFLITASSLTAQNRVFNRNADYSHLFIRYNTGLMDHVSNRVDNLDGWKDSIVRGIGVEIAVSRSMKIGIALDFLDQNNSTSMYNTYTDASETYYYGHHTTREQYVKTYGFQVSYYPTGFNEGVFKPYVFAGFSGTRYTFRTHEMWSVTKADQPPEVWHHSTPLMVTSVDAYSNGYVYGLGIDFFPYVWLNPFFEFRVCSVTSSAYKGNVIFMLGIKSNIL